MKKHLFSFMFLFSCLKLCSIFEHDFAAWAAQKEEWKRTDQLLSKSVLKNPDDPNVLFDAGVALSHLEQFQKSEAYFKNAAESMYASDRLKEQAYFNLGNTSVELKKLEAALEQYEQVLHINPESAKAKHNIEVVKKMLEQQQQQNQQDENQEQEKKEDESEQQNKQQQGSDQSQGDSGSDDDKQKKERQEDGNQDSSQKSDSNDDRQQEDRPSDELDQEQDNKEKKKDKRHDDSPEKDERQTDNQDKEGQQEEQENGQVGANGNQPQYDEQVMQILAQIDEKDAQANKRLMASHIKQAAGDYDKNQNNY